LKKAGGVSAFGQFDRTGKRAVKENQVGGQRKHLKQVFS